MCCSDFWAIDAVCCTHRQQSDCILQDEFSHLFLPNTLQFLPKLENVSTKWLELREYPILIYPNIYAVFGICPLRFPPKADTGFSNTLFCFDLVICKKYRDFLCCGNSEVGTSRTEPGPVGLCLAQRPFATWVWYVPLGTNSPPHSDCTCVTERRVFPFVSRLFRFYKHQQLF